MNIDDTDLHRDLEDRLDALPVRRLAPEVRRRILDAMEAPPRSGSWRGLLAVAASVLILVGGSAIVLHSRAPLSDRSVRTGSGPSYVDHSVQLISRRTSRIEIANWSSHPPAPEGQTP